jgi:tetratricopeptide (TPR) repeat protein
VSSPFVLRSDRRTAPRPRFGQLRHPAWAICALLFLPVVSGLSFADAPRSAMREGLREYREERFREAADAFRAAAEHAPGARLDPARALYNHANALYQQGRFEEAAAAYEEALRSTDLDVQQSAHFNRGNALLAQAYQRAEAQEYDAAKALTERALDGYRNALLLQPDDRDAKINYELAHRFREELDALLAQQPPEPEPQPGDEGEQEQPDEGLRPEPQFMPEEEPEAPPSPDVPEDEMTAQEMIPDTMEEMTPEEAMLLLDALRDEEQETRDQMRLRLGDPAEVEKDW